MTRDNLPLPLGSGEDDLGGWVYDEHSADVIEKILQTSAFEQLARPEPMQARVKTVPRGGGFQVATVAAGGAYTLGTGLHDDITLTARKVGGALKLNDEDVNDVLSGIDPLRVKRHDATRTLALFMDNAAFATTAAENGTTVPYTSLYKFLRSNGDAGSIEAGYNADDNYLSCTVANFKAALSGSTTGFGKLDSLLALHEESEFFEEDQVYLVASVKFRSLLRNVKDASGNPYLIPRPTSGSAIAATPQYDLFGYHTVWTRGARTSAVATDSPGGNPLLFIGNRNLLIRGEAQLESWIPSSSPGFAFQDSRNGIGFLNDQSYMKAAVRRAMSVGTRQAHAVLEILP